jgi:8-oxo-dGTP pyrophosphatase MutT (NUDIX family)
MDHRKLAGMTIPAHQLPPGFLDAVTGDPAEPVPAHPAATTVLVRDSGPGIEVLLLQRHRRSGFVPGAFVFPGGRVDPADGDPRLRRLVHGELPAAPPLAFRAAAVREVFEETGVLLACTAEGGPVPVPLADARLAAAREQLLQDRATLGDVLEASDLRLEPARLLHFAHWITPLVERRRFDTHFFLAALPAGQQAVRDARESDAVAWLTPAAALERFRAGTLPMVFPTVHTLELLAGPATVGAALDAFRDITVTTILPRLRRGRDGVELIIEPEVS